MLIIKIFVIGFGILIGAVVLNTIATKLSLTTWYDFLQSPKTIKPISYVWLFVVYPGLLGLIAFLLQKVLN